MITFRYHIASLVAVLLALAAGVVLGSGPLRSGQDAALASERSGDDVDAADQEAARLARTLAFEDSFARAAGPRLVAGALPGRAVTLVLLPGADPDVVAALTALAGSAGASVAVTVRVRPDLLDPGNRQLVDELGARLASAAPQARAGQQVGYDRLAALLAYSVGAQRPQGAPAPQPAGGILAGLRTAGLVAVDGDRPRRGGLALVVAGPPEGDDDARRGAGAAVAALAKALDRRTAGAVVAGPGAAAADDGAVLAVRADRGAEQVSTVDTVERAAGQVAAVLALAEQERGGASAYGAAGDTDATLPDRRS